MLNIEHTRKTLVGNEFVRGISGGERKRVSIAEMFATNAVVSSWDNSTRGLDASTALDYAKSLRILTDVYQMVNFVSLYQAGEGIYEQFDKVLVIDEGRQIFFGPVSEARQYFLSLGFRDLPRQTTADYLTGCTDPNEVCVLDLPDGFASLTVILSVNMLMVAPKLMFRQLLKLWRLLSGNPSTGRACSKIARLTWRNLHRTRHTGRTLRPLLSTRRDASYAISLRIRRASSPRSRLWSVARSNSSYRIGSLSSPRTSPPSPSRLSSDLCISTYLRPLQVPSLVAAFCLLVFFSTRLMPSRNCPHRCRVVVSCTSRPDIASTVPPQCLSRHPLPMFPSLLFRS